MRVTVDEETCIGCGLCSETCPEVFEMNDDKVRVKVDEVPEDVVETCREATENCPVEAIQIEELPFQNGQRGNPRRLWDAPFFVFGFVGRDFRPEPYLVQGPIIFLNVNGGFVCPLVSRGSAPYSKYSLISL